MWIIEILLVLVLNYKFLKNYTYIGEIAIFSTGRYSYDQTTKHGQYQFLCRVINDPYDMLGCWCDRDFFLCGELWYFKKS